MLKRLKFFLASKDKDIDIINYMVVAFSSAEHTLLLIELYDFDLVKHKKAVGLKPMAFITEDFNLFIVNVKKKNLSQEAFIIYHNLFILLFYRLKGYAFCNDMLRINVQNIEVIKKCLKILQEKKIKKASGSA